MARIDYADLKNELAQILSAAPTLADIAFTVDDDIRLDSFGCSANIEMVRRDHTAPAQSLSAGQRQRYYVTTVVTVVAVGIDRQAAIEQRDDVIGEIEVVLMRNRTLNDKVGTLFLQGGELFLLKDTSDQSEGYFVAVGEIIVQLDATLSTV